MPQCFQPFNPVKYVKVQIKQLTPEAKIPKQAKPNDAGVDICAVEDIYLVTGEHRVVKTGLAIAFPPGLKCEVLPRSGLAAKFGVSIVNTPGTIDSDYRGEVCVILINHGPKPVNFTKGERIGQLCFVPIFYPIFEVVDELPASSRGVDGLGSTGTK